LWEIGSPFAEKLFIPKPFIMVFVVTHRCNSRCRMCRIWQEDASDDLGLEEIGEIFNDSFSKSIRFMTLTGGEPTLRADLGEIVRIVLQSCPNLEELHLATNGLRPRLLRRQIDRCLEEISSEAWSLTKFVVQLSLDGLCEVHDNIRGVAGAYDNLLKSSQSLLEMRGNSPLLDIRFSCVAQPGNLASLADMRDLAESMGVPIQFSPVVFSADFYQNKQEGAPLRLNAKQGAQLKAFFDALALTESGIWRFQYKNISKMLAGATRQRRCMMGFYGFVLEHDGKLHPCVNCESALMGDLRSQSFGKAWFGAQAAEARRDLRESCCPRCSSICYAFPVNAIEVAVLAVEALKRG